MARRIFRFPDPDGLVPGVVGEPGQRTFFLQAWLGGVPVTVALEKVQVAVLAERLLALVGEMRRRGLAVDGPGATPPAFRTPDSAPAFRVGTLSLAWDGRRPAVTIEAQALAEDEEPDPDADPDDAPQWADDDPDGPDLLAVDLDAARAEAFARQAETLVAAGRPACPMCGQPLDPQGHLCPRRNGHTPLLN
ncbi:MAG TPA: DUF3090 family protein [Candidatus Sulfotelmatobacter sp.]|nr:DUF3090 family protein [Candidatus Sulfotelmatobacter sp.]